MLFHTHKIDLTIVVVKLLYLLELLVTVLPDILVIGQVQSDLLQFFFHNFGLNHNEPIIDLFLLLWIPELELKPLVNLLHILLHFLINLIEQGKNVIFPGIY